MRIEPKKIIASDGREFILRNMDPKEAEKVLNMKRQTNTETHYFLREADEILCTPEGIEKEAAWIQDSLDAERNLELALFDGERVIGSMGFGEVKSFKKIRHRCTFGIGIISEYTNLKLGRQIMEILFEEAKKAGFIQMELGVYEDNPRAIHLYKKLGFVEYGKIPGAFKLSDGSFVDDILMCKKL